MATTSPAITSAHLSPPPPLSAAQATATQPLPSSSSPSLPSASQPNISSSSTPVAALAAASSSYSSTSPSANPTMEASKTRMPSRNPIPLSAAQEGEVRELYHKRVRKICDDQIRGKNTSTAFQKQAFSSGLHKVPWITLLHFFHFSFYFYFNSINLSNQDPFSDFAFHFLLLSYTLSSPWS